MLLGWTLVRYIDQPNDAPDYRRAIGECFVDAFMEVPTDGAGWLLVVVRAYVPRVIRPFLGALIYVVFAILMTRRWPNGRWAVHAVAALIWLLAGAAMNW